MFANRQPVVLFAALVMTLGVGCSTSDTSEESAETAEISTKWVAAPAGKFLLQGQILQKYLEAGGSNSPLGSPISNEKAAPGDGRYTLFEGGAIYWTPRTGAHITAGSIRNAWEFDNGGPAGPLGYPTSDQYNAPGGPQQRFQHGTITAGADGHPRVDLTGEEPDGASPTRQSDR